MSLNSYTFVYVTIIFLASGANTLDSPEKWRYKDTTSGEYVYCDWCRPGEYMSRRCTVESPTVCLPCPKEHYTEQYNHRSECHRCHQCNLMDHGHEHETRSCTTVQNRQCECDDGYFKPTKLTGCIQHTKCLRGQGVKEKGCHQTDTRCMRCSPGTFSDEISSTAECRAHTDCAVRGEHVFRRGNHKRDNVCDGHTTITSSTSNDTVKLHYTDGVKSTSREHITLLRSPVVICPCILVLVLAVSVFLKYPCTIRLQKRLQKRYHIIPEYSAIDSDSDIEDKVTGFREEHHGNSLAIDDNKESNEMPISKEQFQLYNTRMMETLQRKTEAERIAFDLEEQNIHLKQQAASDKREVARLKDQITSLTTNNTYRMSRKPRGVAVIINNIHFEDMANRGGAEGDTGRLREAFESLGFTAMTFSDLDHSKMVATIKDQGKADHSNYDCFVCCIMSHGTTGKVFSSDDVGIDICELMKPFHANKCSSLKGKPKLFFIQAYQGEKTQRKEGFDHGEHDAKPVPFICHEADFFLGLATVPGYVARRDQDGAPYVKHLAKLLKDFGPTHDLSAIMAMVCDKMNEINDDKFGWISSNHSTLRKKVFFNTK